MITGAGFEIMIASFPDYDRLVAEIYCNGKFVLLISQEGDSEQFELETPGPNLKEEYIARKVDLIGLQQVIELACQKLRPGA